MKSVAVLVCLVMTLSPLGIAQACWDEPIVVINATVSAKVYNHTDGCLQVSFYPPPPDVKETCT